MFPFFITQFLELQVDFWVDIFRLHCTLYANCKDFSFVRSKFIIFTELFIPRSIYSNTIRRKRQREKEHEQKTILNLFDVFNVKKHKQSFLFFIVKFYTWLWFRGRSLWKCEQCLLPCLCCDRRLFFEDSFIAWAWWGGLHSESQSNAR